MRKAREYDLTKQSEVDRLLYELRSYMKVSITDGTDREGRQYALYALEELLSGKYAFVVYGDGD